MDSIGDFFKQVRETKGLTVDEVASKTRIRTDFVKALEEGNFAKLPDQVFARGFVRSYARSLGLDEDDAIHRFIQSAGAFYEKQDERERLKIRQAEEERKRQANRKAVAIAIGIAVVILIFLLSREQSSVLRRGSPEPPSTKRTTQTTVPEAETRQQSDTAAVPPKTQETASPAAGQGTETARSEATTSQSATPKPESDTVSTASPGTDGPLGGISLDGAGGATDG